MTKKEFTSRVLNEKADVLQGFLDILRTRKIRFCVIGGLAVNAYAEPVVSLDLDIVVATERLRDLREILPAGFKVKEFANSLNISHRDSDLRIQAQTDPRYQAFLPRSRPKDVLGYAMPVARAEDVLKGQDLGGFGPNAASEQAPEGPGGYPSSCRKPSLLGGTRPGRVKEAPGPPVDERTSLMEPALDVLNRAAIPDIAAPILAVVLLIAASAFAQTVVENPAKPDNPRAGRVVTLQESHADRG